jgi:hypothetical protein
MAKVFVLRFPRVISGSFAAVDWWPDGKGKSIGSTSDVGDRKRLIEQFGAEDITAEFMVKQKAEAEKKALETAELEVKKKADEEKKIVEIVERAVREGTLKISPKVIK